MELNKIAAAILVAGLVAMAAGKVSSALYYGSEGAPGAHHGDHHEEAKRGYSIDVPEGGVDVAAGAEKKELPKISGLLAGADIAAGEKYFAKKCATCHTNDSGGKNKTGPNLWNIVDRAKGGSGGFNYSKAMAAFGGNWSYEDLNAFLHKPKKWMPGTIMAFAGIKKEKDRADLIAYLRTLSNAPKTLPPAAAPEPETAEAAE
ncbi:MAG: cytochrome c family protein [Rickettsiales bacterium]|nr:cytochrome c family protein [Rickettsiales bacterium]